MSEQAGTTARALFEQQAHAAMTRYDHNLGEYTRKTAYNTLIDELLKAWETTALHALEQRVREQIAAAGEAQVARLRAQLTSGDQPAMQAQRRGALDAYGMRKRTG